MDEIIRSHIEGMKAVLPGAPLYSPIRDGEGFIVDWMYHGDCICGNDGTCPACIHKQTSNTTPRGKKNG